MLGRFRHLDRRARQVAGAARCIVEALEPRKLFNATTWAASDPTDPSAYCGVDNTSDPTNV
jgi:hypothetical protein